MKKIKEILSDANNKQTVELNKIIDKSVPSGIIDKRIDMLKEETPAAILSLINCNILFKKVILSEVNYVEDMLATGIYNSKYGQIKCKYLLEKEEYKDFWPKDLQNKKRDKFKENLIDNNKSLKKEENLEKTLFEVFYSKTLGGKILLVELMDREIVSNLIKSKTKIFKKSELISLLEYSKRIRNHVAHNFFVLNKGPYLKMIQKSDIKKQNLNSEEENLKFLFSRLETILKINSRANPIKTLRKEIKKQKYINLKHLDLTILKM